MILLHSLARTYGGDPASHFDPDLPPLARFGINVAAIQVGSEEEERIQLERIENARREEEARQRNAARMR